MDNDVVVRLGNVWMFVGGNLPEGVKKQIQLKMSYVVPGFKFMPYFKQQQAFASATGTDPKWDGTRTVARRTQGGMLQAPTGLYSYLKEVLTENNIPFSVDDQRAPATTSPGWSTEGLVLRDYQSEVEQTLLRVQRGVMKMSTGAGKTLSIASIMAKVAVFPAVFYVPSCDILEQTYDVFSKYIRYNGQPTPIGRVGAGHCDIRPITIATVQSCQLAIEGKYSKFDDEDHVDNEDLSDSQKKDIREMVEQAQFAAIDECQHCACDTIQAVLNNSPRARFRVGCSASPWRDDGLDILIEACFGKRFCDIDASFLINAGYLVRPRISFNHFWHSGPAANYQAAYTKFVVENDARNRFVAERAAFHVSENRPTIVLVKWARHAEILHDMIPGSEVLTSSGTEAKSPKKRKDVLNLMRERKLMCIIGTTLLDEGVDVPAANAGIFAGGGKSSTRALQRVGRFIRKDKLDESKDVAYIEEFHDHCRWLDHHAKMRKKILATEREFEIIDNRATGQNVASRDPFG